MGEDVSFDRALIARFGCQVQAFDLSGRPQGELPQPALSAVDDLVVFPDGEILYEIQSLTMPPAWHRRPRDGGPAARTAL